MEINYDNLGGDWSIESELFEWIITNIPHNSNIIELGSGLATNELIKFYNVWSIEQNKEWADICKSNCIYAPIVNGWFDRNKIIGNLPDKYEMVLVDAPTANTVGRKGLLSNLDLFDTSVTFIFDDINRQDDFDNMVSFSNKVNRPFYIFYGRTKKFGVIHKNDFENPKTKSI